MARCLRCHADSSWIEGNVKPACCDHEDRISELEAELAALRSAPPKIDGVPTVPGLYFVRANKGAPWLKVAVIVSPKSGRMLGYVCHANHWTHLSPSFFEDGEWIGPLTPPKETT